MVELFGGLAIGGLLGYFAKGKVPTKEASKDSCSLEEENKKLKHEINELQKLVERLQSKLDDVSTISSNKVETPARKVISAKEAIAENIGLLSPMLKSLLDGTFCPDKWDDVIIDIDNSELASMWGKVRTKTDSILRVLAVWGIRPDFCDSFVSMGEENEMYDLDSGGDVEKGKKYEVLSKCWLLTGDKGDKSVLLKGIVKLIG